MQHTTSRALLLAASLWGVASAHGATITFEDASAANEQAYAGPGGGRYWSGLVPPSFASIDSSFVSGGARFLNTNTDWGGVTAFEGFAYSNTADTATGDFTNQYSAYSGGGAGGSANYGLAFAGEFGAAPRIEFADPATLAGAMFANTTYTALSMLNGDGFAKHFGGASGDDPDFLLLTITGRDAANAVTGTLEVYLADYRAANNANDFVLDGWTQVALGSLGTVAALEFRMSSSDVGAFGYNTPLYFAIDDIQVDDFQVVPLPAAAWLLAPALGLLATRRRRRPHRGVAPRQVPEPRHRLLHAAER